MHSFVVLLLKEYVHLPLLWENTLCTHFTALFEEENTNFSTFFLSELF